VATALRASATGVLEQPAGCFPPRLRNGTGHFHRPCFKPQCQARRMTGPIPGSLPPRRTSSPAAHSPSLPPAMSDAAQEDRSNHFAEPLLPDGVCNCRSRCQSRTSAQPAQTPNAARLAHTEIGTRTIAKTNMIHASIVISSLLHTLHGVLPTFYSNRIATRRQFPKWASGPCGTVRTGSLRQAHRRWVRRVRDRPTVPAPARWGSHSTSRASNAADGRCSPR
jgi:hypothetical protein